MQAIGYGTAIARAKILNDPSDLQLIADAEAGNKSARKYLISKFTLDCERAAANHSKYTPENFADELPESTFYGD